MSFQIGFLGAGRMATALAGGFLRAGLVRPDEVIASDPHPAAREAFAAATGAAVTDDNAAVAAAPDLIVAVKPGQVAAVLGALGGRLTPAHRVLSIAAGVTVARLEAAVPAGVRVLRVMPNTPALVGASATAYCRGASAGPDDARRAAELFGAVGVALEVPEALMDAVTGLSGSGPAYAFVMIEALADGGVAAGLPRGTAQRLAAQTLLGAARMVLETGQHPGALKDAVASPGGTTIEGLHALEKAGVRAGLMNAVRAAAEKAGRMAG